MPTVARVPLEVYLRSDDYEPDAEYVEGEIEERPMGEEDHSSWQGAIVDWFRQHRREWGIRVRPELRVQTSATRFRVADVAILDRAAPLTPIAVHPPLAVFEILSPEDRVQRLMQKLSDYASMGVAEIWVVDPKSGVFSRFEDGRWYGVSGLCSRSDGLNFLWVRLRRWWISRHQPHQAEALPTRLQAPALPRPFTMTRDWLERSGFVSV